MAVSSIQWSCRANCWSHDEIQHEPRLKPGRVPCYRKLALLKAVWPLRVSRVGVCEGGIAERLVFQALVGQHGCKQVLVTEALPPPAAHMLTMAPACLMTRRTHPLMALSCQAAALCHADISSPLWPHEPASSSSSVLPGVEGCCLQAAALKKNGLPLHT